MEIQITCFFCFEDFSFYLETKDFEGVLTDIWDCNICCNPNMIKVKINSKSITVLEVRDGNE